MPPIPESTDYAGRSVFGEWRRRPTDFLGSARIDLDKYNLGPDPYLEHIAKAKKSVGIPIIASVNGVSTGGWTRYAKMLGSMARRAVPNPSGFERSNYLKVLGSYAIEDADFVGDLAVKSSF